jgi:hypothetical protein
MFRTCKYNNTPAVMCNAHDIMDSARLPAMQPAQYRAARIVARQKQVG